MGTTGLSMVVLVKAVLVVPFVCSIELPGSDPACLCQSRACGGVSTCLKVRTGLEYARVLAPDQFVLLSARP